MCIRDRVVLAAVDLAWPGRPGRVRDGEVDGPGEGGVGENPVSYTHLRAHETVLDLVCRLLLEKKKQHIMRLKLGQRSIT